MVTTKYSFNVIVTANTKGQDLEDGSLSLMFLMSIIENFAVTFERNIKCIWKKKILNNTLKSYKSDVKVKWQVNYLGRCN